jgi:hypothetical protein
VNAYSNLGASDPRLYDENQTIEAENARILVAAAENADGLKRVDNVMKGIKEEALVQAWQSGKKAFVSPMRVKGSYMVKPGVLTTVYPGTNTPVMPGSPATSFEQRRIGDIKAVFQGNVLIVDPSTPDGAVIYEWALAHPEICRDAENAETEVWAAFKQGQLNLATREPSIPVNIDVDRVMRGDYSGFNESNSIAARARKRLATEAAAR